LVGRGTCRACEKRHCDPGLKFEVVSEKTGKPIGFGLSVLRQVAHLIDASVLCIGYVLPLWDAKRQTLADKIMATVCLPLDRSAEHEAA
jgi:RDD family